MRQRNLNLLIGNSSVAHMGFAFLGIASLSTIGITGTVVIMVAHGFLAALTFALQRIPGGRNSNAGDGPDGRIAARPAVHRDGHDHGHAGGLRPAGLRQFSRRSDGAVWQLGPVPPWLPAWRSGARWSSPAFICSAPSATSGTGRSSGPGDLRRRRVFGASFPTACFWPAFSCWAVSRDLLTDGIEASVEPVVRMASGSRNCMVPPADQRSHEHAPKLRKPSQTVQPP